MKCQRPLEVNKIGQGEILGGYNEHKDVEQVDFQQTVGPEQVWSSFIWIRILIMDGTSEIFGQIKRFKTNPHTVESEKEQSTF